MPFVIEETFHHGIFNGYNFVFRNKKIEPKTKHPVAVSETDVRQLPAKCCHVVCNNKGKYAQSLKTNAWFCKCHLKKPFRTYEFVDNGSANISECPICYETIRSEAECVTTTCDHVFHKMCLTRWCIEHNSCPMCRTDLHFREIKGLFKNAEEIGLLLNLNLVTLSRVLQIPLPPIRCIAMDDDITNTERIIRALKKHDTKLLEKMYNKALKQVKQY